MLATASVNPDGLTEIAEICYFTGVDDELPSYYGRPRSVNDFHGLGAFLVMSEQTA